MKIGAIIQARTASTRLSKKILKELPYGRALLYWSRLYED